MDTNDDWLDYQLAWKDLREAYIEGNVDDMEASAGELLDWLGEGRTPPQTSSDPPMDDNWNRMIARACCHFVLQSARHQRAGRCAPHP